jgi:DNA-binding LytR/AlgR family response regulator
MTYRELAEPEARFMSLLPTLAEKLLPYGFVQTHRGVLVNSSWVHGIHPRSTGDYVLCTRGGKEYPVSITYKQNLRSLAPLWIGSDVLLPNDEQLSSL